MAQDSEVRRDDITDDSSSGEDDNCSQPQLRPLIQKNHLMSVFDKTPHKFVPEGFIEDVMTEDVIKRTLNIKQPSKKADEIVSFIKTRATRTFAIVVWIKADDIMTVMKSLKKRDIDDKELPVTNKERLGTKDWVSDFYDDQWRFVAPIFSTNTHNHDLEESRILPFISKNMDSGRGSFGVVSRYVVHRKHLSPVSDCPKIKLLWKQSLTLCRCLRKIHHSLSRRSKLQKTHKKWQNTGKTRQEPLEQ